VERAKLCIVWELDPLDIRPSRVKKDFTGPLGMIQANGAQNGHAIPCCVKSARYMLRTQIQTVQSNKKGRAESQDLLPSPKNSI
jgi:hypothetical protein